MSAPSQTSERFELERLAQSLLQLGDELRLVLEFRYFDGLLLSDIATRLNRDVSVVVRLLRDGLRQLVADPSLNSEFVTRRSDATAQQEDRLDAALAEYLSAADEQRPPDRTEFLQQHNDLASDLAGILNANDRLLACAPALREALSAVGTATFPGGPKTLEDRQRTRQLPESTTTPERPLISIPGFVIEGVLGEGGMGIVYLARQLSLGRRVALKMIHSRLAGGQRAIHHFREEGNALARLNDPHIVQVYGSEFTQNAPYLVLEYVEGGTLSQRIANKPQPAIWCAQIALTLARTMHKVHQAGIVHRDLKPGNVLLTPTGEPKITDFGLARLYDGAAGLAASEGVAGTPSYMAPEQAESRLADIGPVTDVYAIGAILYEMLTGRPPFREATQLATLDKVRHEDPPSLRSRVPQVPQDLQTIVHKCLEKSPARRYPSAQVLADRLSQFLAGEPIPDVPRGWLSRTVRAVMKRPVRSLTVATVLLTVVTILLAVRLASPQPGPIQPLATVPDLSGSQRERDLALALGQEFVFHGHEPLPGPFRQVVGPGNQMARNPGADYFSLDAHGVVLWELTEDPRTDRYLFTADVRHDEAGGDSQIGIYCAFRTITGEGIPRQGAYHVLHFADRGLAPRKDAEGVHQSFVRFSGRLFRDVSPPDNPESPGLGISFPAAMLVGTPGPWRRLRLQVTPEGVAAFWQPDAERGDDPEKWVPVTTRTLAEMSLLTTRALRTMPRFAALPTAVHPRQGVGLYVSRGRASFRNVILKPLPRD